MEPRKGFTIISSLSRKTMERRSFLGSLKFCVGCKRLLSRSATRSGQACKCRPKQKLRSRSGYKAPRQRDLKEEELKVARITRQLFVKKTGMPPFAAFEAFGDWATSLWLEIYENVKRDLTWQQD